MPRAPTYIAPRFGGSGNVSRPTNTFGDQALGRGVSDLGAAIANLGITLIQKQAFSAANKKVSQFKSSVAEQQIEARKAAGPGAEGFTPSFMEQFDTASEELLSSAANNVESRLIEASLDRYRNVIFQSSLDFEATAGVTQRKLDLLDSIDLTANHIRSNPGEFEDGLAEQMGTLDSIRSDLPPTDETQLEETIGQKLAVAAIQGEIELAPGLALNELNSGKWDKYITPAQKNTLINQAQAGANTVDSVARARLRQNMENHLASIKATGIGIVGINEDRIKEVIQDPQEQEILIMALERGERFSEQQYLISSTITTGSAEERRTVVEGARDRALTPGKSLDQLDREDGVGAADAQSLAIFAAETSRAFNHALENDPAGVAIQNSSVVDRAREQGTIPGIEASIAEQVRLGVSEHVARVFTEAEVSARVLDLSTGDPAEDLQKLGQYRDEFGEKYFAKAMSELIGGGLDPLVTILDSVALNDPIAGVRALQALRLSPEDTKSQFNSVTTVPYSDLEVAVQDVMVPAAQAVTGAGSSLERLEWVRRYQELITRVAATDAVLNGFDDINDSVQKWAGRLFYDHYLMQDSYVLPRADDNGNAYDVNSIMEYTEQSLSNQIHVELLNADPSAITLEEGIPVSVAHEITNLTIAKNGMWVNTNDGKGLQLMMQTGMGSSIVRHQGTGDPYILSFRDIERLGQDIFAERERVREIVEATSLKAEFGD